MKEYERISLDSDVLKKAFWTELAPGSSKTILPTGLHESVLLWPSRVPKKPEQQRRKFSLWSCLYSPMAQDWGQELNCPEFLFQDAAETQQSHPLRASGKCQRFVGGPYTATGVQEVAQVTGFSCRLALRCHHVAAVQHTRLDFSCSSDGIFVPPLTEETQGLHSALNFKIQE